MMDIAVTSIGLNHYKACPECIKANEHVALYWSRFEYEKKQMKHATHRGLAPDDIATAMLESEDALDAVNSGVARMQVKLKDAETLRQSEREATANYAEETLQSHLEENGY